MKTLYHGSYLEVTHPIARAGRKNLDFGQGFYLTTIREQAEAWARIISTRRGRSVNPVVSVFRFDEDSARLDGFRFKVFETYDIEWLNYVVDCRQGKNTSADFDIVEGGVANDNVIDTVEDYEKGVITAQQALGQLRYKKVNHQICILNQAVIDNFLTFVESDTLEIDEEDM